MILLHHLQKHLTAAVFGRIVMTKQREVTSLDFSQLPSPSSHLVARHYLRRIDQFKSLQSSEICSICPQTRNPRSYPATMASKTYGFPTPAVTLSLTANPSQGPSHPSAPASSTWTASSSTPKTNTPSARTKCSANTADPAFRGT